MKKKIIVSVVFLAFLSLACSLCCYYSPSMPSEDSIAKRDIESKRDEIVKITPEQTISNKAEDILHCSTFSEMILIDNWTEAELVGICTGEGSYSNPYVIQDLIIDGSQLAGNVNGISIIYSKNVFFRIENCTIFNCGIGILLDNSCNGTLLKNICYNNYQGIYLDGWTSKHIFTYEEYTAFYCMNNTLDDNDLSNNAMGIYMRRGWNNTIINNNINYNVYGLYMQGIERWGFNNIEENTFINSEQYGVYLDRSWCNQFKKNQLTSCGFTLISGNNNSISLNIINSPKIGIDLTHSNNTSILNNTIYNYNEKCINEYNCENNIIFGNMCIPNRSPLILGYDLSLSIGIISIISILLIRKRFKS